MLGDGEEVVADITCALGGWKASGRTEGSRQAVLREPSHVEGVYVPRCTTSSTTAADPAVTPCFADVPESRSAPSPTWPSGPTPKRQLVPLTEVVHDRLNVEVFRAAPAAASAEGA